MDKTTKSDDEWREVLSPLAFEVTRKRGTERPFSHDDFPAAPGRFHCTCCGAELFDQSDKFDAGCGWPSFTRPAGEEAPVGESVDLAHGMRRTEVHCTNCGAHGVALLHQRGGARFPRRRLKPAVSAEGFGQGFEARAAAEELLEDAHAGNVGLGHPA